MSHDDSGPSEKLRQIGQRKSMSAYAATRPWLSAIQPVTVAEFGSVARADLWAFDTMRRRLRPQTLSTTSGEVLRF